MGTMLLSVNGWFAGLLTVMIVITILFAVILFIALRPVTKGEIGIKQLLSRREAEITAEILNNKDDKVKTDALIIKLREVQSAENLIKELAGDDEEAQPAGKKKFSIADLFKGKKPAPKKPVKKDNKPKVEKPVTTAAHPKVEKPVTKEAEHKVEKPVTKETEHKVEKPVEPKVEPAKEEAQPKAPKAVEEVAATKAEKPSTDSTENKK